MKFLKNLTILLVGFAFGAVVRPAPLKAQYGSNGTKVTVQEVPSLGSTGMVVAQGSQIVGFSCIADEHKEADCYVASVK